MKQTHHILVIASCALSLVAAGCSTQTKTEATVTATTPETAVTAPAASDLQACQILTPEIAKKYLGETKEPTANNGPVTSNCTYASSGDSFGALTFLIKHSSATEQEGAVPASKSLSGVDPEMIDGLGDKAYWAGGKLNQLNVFKGNDWYIISAFMDGYNKDKAIEVMKDILANSK
ncbi:MAG: hypothetical protein WC551_02960 [Patescibacteria group bacterium]